MKTLCLLSMKSAVPALLVASALAVASPAAVAQGETPSTKPLDEQTLLTLHTVGIKPEAILSSIERNGLSVLLAGARSRLEAAGLDPRILARIDAEASRRASAGPTVEEIVALVQSGTAIPKVLERIARSPEPYALQPDQVINLHRKGVPTDVLRAMREHVPPKKRDVTVAENLSIEDLMALANAGFSTDAILQRIRRSDSRFDVDAEGLLRLVQIKALEPLVPEIWSRRTLPQEPEVQPLSRAEVVASATADGLAPPPNAAERAKAFSFLVHREASGGYSMLAPEGWAIARQSSGNNSLLSFTQGQIADSVGLADAELQIMRIETRAQDKERLVTRNLGPIASNVLQRLRANYVTKGLSLKHDSGAETVLAGQPALVYEVSSTAQDGSTHTGRFYVTYHEGRVFVVSYAVRADLIDALHPHLEDAVLSLTHERRITPFELAEKRLDRVIATFERWRKSVLKRDFGLWRSTLDTKLDTVALRLEFVALTKRFAEGEKRVMLGPVSMNESGSRAQVRIIGPRNSETIELKLVDRPSGALLAR